MRIAYLVNRYPGVTHSFIRREIFALERRGFEVMRLSLRHWDGVLTDEEDRLERKNTRYVLRDGAGALVIAVIRMLVTRPLRFMRSLTLAWRMSRRADRPFLVHCAYLAEACRVTFWLKTSSIQHLHAHFGTNSAEIAMLVHSLGGPPWSFTVHGPEEFDKGQFIGMAEKIRRAAFVVAISSYGRSQLYRLVEHQHWSKIKVVHCGLEPAFHSLPASPSTGARRFVCVGRLCEQKGQLLLLEAARRLAARSIDFELVLAGDGELRAEIDALVEHHKLQDCVRVTGWISSEKVRDEILAAQALVLPSFAEGLPVVIMEAMALRRPIISTYVAGIPELVQPGKHGWLVPAGDAEALAQAMQACLDAPREVRESMGNAAHERVFIRHNIDTEAAKLENLFRSVH